MTTLIEWFAKPLLIALVLRYSLKWLSNEMIFEKIISLSGTAIPFAISLLVIQLFAANIDILIANSNMFAWMLLGVFSFFLLTFVLSEVMSKVFKLNYPEHVLLTMTVAARNAPLMLAITMVVLPDQPIVFASIIVGMLLEFPHLAMLTFVLKRKHAKQKQSIIA
jgi:ACR3 family arsenite efflux pump ArsB